MDFVVEQFGDHTHAARKRFSLFATELKARNVENRFADFAKELKASNVENLTWC